jgi:hypothetical protein
MSLGKCLAKALVYLVLEIGALAGVPMRPDQIAEIMEISGRQAVQIKRDEKGDGNGEPPA